MRCFSQKARTSLSCLQRASSSLILPSRYHIQQSTKNHRLKVMFIKVTDMKRQAELTQRPRRNMSCRVTASRNIALLILNLGARREWVVNATPSAILPLGKCPGTQEGGCTPGPICKGAEKRKSLPPLGFEPRTVQRVASRYTDYVISAIFYAKHFKLMFAIYSCTPVQARHTRSNSYDSGLFL